MSQSWAGIHPSHLSLCSVALCFVGDLTSCFGWPSYFVHYRFFDLMNRNFNSMSISCFIQIHRIHFRNQDLELLKETSQVDHRRSGKIAAAAACVVMVEFEKCQLVINLLFSACWSFLWFQNFIMVNTIYAISDHKLDQQQL